MKSLRKLSQKCATIYIVIVNFCRNNKGETFYEIVYKKASFLKMSL